MQASRWIGSFLAAFAACAAHAAITPADLHLERWPTSTTTFSQPIAIRHANDGSGRVFVIERCSAIRIVKNGALLATPFLSLTPSCGGEQGILGLAFDPDYANNGTFYVTYTAPSTDPRLGATADQVLARYTVSANPDVANPTGTVILRVPDIANNHNGGDLHFDAQGYINWSMGDGGVQGDPNGFAQCTGRKKADNNPATCHTIAGSGPTYYLLGKIIRLDVHHSTASAPANFCGATAGQAAPYAIPPGNPFVDASQYPNECAEIFNWGFRNPFRFSIDRQTGDMLIGDVGQNKYEEIDFQPAASAGQNFQWNWCEGLHSYPGGASGCSGPSGSVPPKIELAFGRRRLRDRRRQRLSRADHPVARAIPIQRLLHGRDLRRRQSRSRVGDVDARNACRHAVDVGLRIRRGRRGQSLRRRRRRQGVSIRLGADRHDVHRDARARPARLDDAVDAADRARKRHDRLYRDARSELRDRHRRRLRCHLDRQHLHDRAGHRRLHGGGDVQAGRHHFRGRFRRRVRDARSRGVTAPAVPSARSR
jgi:glucose/arabinose dehydrogenase